MNLFQRYKKSVTPLFTIFFWVVVITALAYSAVHFWHFITDHDVHEVHFLIFIATFSAVVGYLTGIFPARRASLLNPLDAIRYE